eukprot:s42_g43.t3
MVLTVPMPDELMRRRKRAFSALARDGDADGVELLVFGRLPSGGDSNEEVTLNEIFVGVGASSTGKTTMLGELMKEHDPSAMTNFEEQRSNLMTHHTLQIGSRSLKFLDCSGNERAGHLVKEWFGRTQWVFVIYSLADVKSYQKALTLMAEARQAGAGVVLFANKYDVGKEGKEVQVNLREAHDRATQSQAYSVEGSSLSDAVRFVASQDDSAEAPAEGAAAPDAAAAEDAKQRSSIANAIDSVKSWFGGPPERGGKGGGVLRPSLKGTKAMKQARRDGDPNVDLRPVQELQDSESAVTCATAIPRSCFQIPSPQPRSMVEHCCGHPPGPSNDGSLAYRLEDYLLSASCLMELNAFAQRHAYKFEDDHPHDWYDIFQEYENMMRKRTDEFLHREGVTAEQAVEECFRKRNEGNSQFQYFESLAKRFVLDVGILGGRGGLCALSCPDARFQGRPKESGAVVDLSSATGGLITQMVQVAFERCCFEYHDGHDTELSLDRRLRKDGAAWAACWPERVQYILFVTASKDGNIVVYRCYRTEMEIAMLANEDFRGDTSPQPADHSNIAVHSRLVGHARAITSVFFNLLEDQLISTSIDKSVRFWNVDTGEMLKVFTDSSPVPVATFLPFNPQVFVAANSNAVLRLVNLQNGMVLQKLKVETEVRTLKFDDTGMFLLAGTKSGSIHVLEATDNNMLKFKFKVQLARGGDDGYPMSKTRVDRLTAMSGEGEVEKRRLNEDSKRLLEAEASHLASYYSQFGIHYAFLGIDKSVNPKVREAAVIYSLAEEHLLDLELEEALKKATQALELFREAKSKPGQQDAVRLLCSVERQKQDPDFSIDKIQTELRSCRDSEDKRGQGAMLLALAEAQLAKALAGEALSNIEEALPLLRAAGDKRQLQLG